MDKLKIKDEKKVRVLGIDVGFAICGWGVVDKSHLNNKLVPVSYGAITTHKDLPIEQRLSTIYTELLKIITEYKPDEVAVESLFYFKNQKTVINVAQARGAILLSIVNSGVPAFEYTPLQVKTAVSSYGRADKKQVQKMVKLILGLQEIPKPDDAADGLAIAICHLNTRKN